MEKDKRKLTWRNLIPELFCAAVVTGAGYGICVWQQRAFDIFLSNAVLFCIGMAIVGFYARQSYINNELDYDNTEHPLRFWGWFLAGVCVAFACIFLPAAGWPFLAVFVVLTLFSNLSCGILASSVLLTVPMLFAGVSVGTFMIYFLSGIFAAALFHRLENEFKIGIPLFLSLLCLLLCDMAGLILVQNERFTMELLVIPATNIIISCILLVGILKIFSTMVIYKYRIRYLELNDTEYPLLAECRKEAKKEYLFGIHTAYFCERIASRLGMNVDALKCAGYYHRLKNRLTQEEWQDKLPPDAYAILEEYWTGHKRVCNKENAVLLAADTIVSNIIQLYEKEKDRRLDYEKIINTVFEHFEKTGTFDECNITLRELKMMQKIFKEEKLYYDFLR